VSDELKPCPFCGSVVEIVYADQQSSSWERVWCNRCGPLGSIMLATERDGLITWWNTRAERYSFKILYSEYLCGLVAGFGSGMTIFGGHHLSGLCMLAAGVIALNVILWSRQ
jgi:Lar family restriction alleviation protein